MDEIEEKEVVERPQKRARKPKTWKWCGEARFIPGIPARDISIKEAKERGIEAILESSPCYEKE